MHDGFLILVPEREGAKMTSGSDVDATFANTFVVHGDAEGNAVALQTLSAADHLRKKRAHRKSRRGCMACKRRRVKVKVPPSL